MTLAALLLAAGAPSLEVTLSSSGGEVFLSVHADAVPASELLAEIAFRTGRTFVFPDDLADQPLTVDLVRRPLDLVVHVVSGAAGLRGRLTPSAIVLQADVPLGAAADELDEAAEVQYMRTLRRFPDHELAPRAELTLGLIQEDRGQLDAACDQYDLLVQRHGRSSLAPEALWRSGRLLERLGRWSEAWAEFGALLNRSDAHPYGTVARFELARISLELGDAQQAEYLIDALDRDLPPETRAELRQRLALRGAIMLANGRANDALRTIDQVDRMGADGIDAALESLRARALEAAGRAEEAGRAWLAAAGAAQDEAPRAAALHDAARLAFAAGDDLAVLFVDRHARGLGLGDAVEPWPSRARERLGFADGDLGPGDGDLGLGDGGEKRSPASGLAAIESMLAEERWQQAFDAAGQLLAAPAGPGDDEQRLRTVFARARAMQGLGRAEEALAVLREHLDRFERLEERTRIYLRAGELLEQLGRFDEAADAYGGRF